MTTAARFVAYLRVSTSRQGKSGLGLEAQRDAVQRYAASVGGRIIAPEFVEVESGKNNSRPQLHAALERCKVTGATLLVAKLDRLSRNVAFLASLMDSKVSFVAVDNPHANELTIHILAAVAQAERKAISERTKVALAAARKRGVQLGGWRGFNNLVAGSGAQGARDAARAFATRLLPMVMELEREGLSLNKIAARFNSDGIQSRRGGTWTATAVANLKAAAA